MPLFRSKLLILYQAPHSRTLAPTCFAPVLYKTMVDILFNNRLNHEVNWPLAKSFAADQRARTVQAYLVYNVHRCIKPLLSGHSSNILLKIC